MNCKDIWMLFIGGGHGLSDDIKKELAKHSHHKLELVQYGGKYYAIECITCHEVILDDETLNLEESEEN